MIKRLVILFLAIGLCQQNSIAQDTLASLKKLNSLSTLYSNGKIKKQAYLDSIQFWLGRNEQDALFFDKDSLLKYLTLFKKIAWSDTSFSKYQSRYFVYLSNNESHKGNQGFAIYFLDKCDSFNLALKKKKTFYALELQCGFLRDAKNYKKIIALYSKNLSSFNTYPRWLEQDSISGNDALNASKFMGIVAEAYASIGDTAGLNRIIELGEQIKNVYLKKVDNKSMYAYVMTYNTLDLYFIKYFTL